MKTILFTTTLLCAASLGLSGTVSAAPNDSSRPSPSVTPANITPYKGFLLGTKIAGGSIKNLQNETIGTIKDLIVNPDTRRVRFAILSIGGFLGLSDTEVVTPWGAIALEKNKPGGRGQRAGTSSGRCQPPQQRSF